MGPVSPASLNHGEHFRDVKQQALDVKVTGDHHQFVTAEAVDLPIEW
jgi:hypothetical protein